MEKTGLFQIKLESNEGACRQSAAGRGHSVTPGFLRLHVRSGTAPLRVCSVLRCLSTPECSTAEQLESTTRFRGNYRIKCNRGL